MTSSAPTFEQFIADTFDSEEGVMIAAVLRTANGEVSPSLVLEKLESDYGVPPEEPRRLAEKRVELRLRDLAKREIVEQLPGGGTFRYRGRESGVDALVELAIRRLDDDRTGLSRLIYSTSARARRLAEAFRF